MAFGTSLPTRIPASGGAVINVTTPTQLQTALDTCAYGSIIDLGGNTLDLSGQTMIWENSRDGGGVVTTIRNGILDSSPVDQSGLLILGDWLRVEDMEINNSRMWGVKVEGADHIELLRVNVFDSVRSSFLIGYGSTYWQVWDCQSHNAGQVPDNDGFGAYGIYAESYNNQCVVANLLVVNSERWAWHVYTGYTQFEQDGLIITGCTGIHTGSDDKGGFVISGVVSPTNVKCVGCVVVDSPNGLMEMWESLSADDRVAGCVDFAATGPTYQLANTAPVSYTTSDPLLDVDYKPQVGSSAIGLVPTAFGGSVSGNPRDYLPATDLEGNARVTADAGCYAFLGTVESVAWGYDGAMEVTATISNAEIGVTYEMLGITNTSSDSAVAVSTTLVLNVTDFDPADGQPSGEMFVRRTDNGNYVGATVFKVGEIAELNAPHVHWDFDHPDTVRVSFNASSEKEYGLSIWTPALGEVNPAFFDGNNVVETFQNISSADLDGEKFVSFLYETNSGYDTYIGARLFSASHSGSGNRGNPGGDLDVQEGEPEPPAECSPAELVAWEYDGAMEVVATITNAEPGVEYGMFGFTNTSFAAETAVTSTLVLTVTDFVPVDSVPSGEMLVTRNDTGVFIGAMVFEIGNGQLATPNVAWEFAGGDVTATFTTVLDQVYILYPAGPPEMSAAPNSYVGTGAEDTFTLGGDYAGEYFVVLLIENDLGIYTTVGVRLFSAVCEGSGYLGNPGGGEDQSDVPVPEGNPVGGCGGGAAWNVQTGRFFESPLWRILVTELDGTPVTLLDRHAFDRRIEYVLNGPAVGTGTVNSDDPQVNLPLDDDPYMSEGNRLMYWFRREGALAGTVEAGPWVCRHAGLVQVAEDTAATENATTAFTCYDPWQRLFRVPILQENGDLINHRTGYYRVPPAVGERADEIALALLSFACGNMDGFPFLIDTPDPWCPSSGGFYTGTVEECANIDIEFQEGMSVGEAWQLLTETGLIDIVLEPIYDPEFRNGYTHQINIYNVAGEIRPEAIFSWDKPGRSLTALTRQLDGTQRQNHVQFYTAKANSVGTPIQDATSTTKYGGYWGQQVFPSERIKSAVDQLAIKRARMMAYGLRTYTMSPAPERSPFLFTEWFLGDRVKVYASNRFRASIPQFAEVPYQRVMGIPLSISDNALESVEQCLITPDGWIEPEE